MKQSPRSAARLRLIFLLNRAQRSVQRRIESQPGRWNGITAAQVGLLFLLAGSRRCTVGEVAFELKVAPAAVTGLSKRMSDAGLVLRMQDEADGRLTRLALTAEGERCLLIAKASLIGMNAQLHEGFSDSELQVVGRWLDHVASI